MKLIITDRIWKHEYYVFERTFSLELLKKAAMQAIGGLGAELKSSHKIPKTKLRKIDITSSGGSGPCSFSCHHRSKQNCSSYDAA